MKYYLIMEKEWETPINNRAVGADFHVCKGEEEKEETIKNIDKRENGYDIEEISKEEYEMEAERIHRKNLRLIAG